ncbi:UNVERIFIED_CONTAM: hypothetical protein RMT77_018346 [Armadillidium vulgare]
MNSIGIKYNLDEDLLLNDDVRPLKAMTLLHIIPRYFTPELLIKYSRPIYPGIINLEQEDTSFRKIFWERIEIEVVEAVKRFIPVSMDKEIREVTHFVGSQIYLFLAKNRYEFATLSIILKNLVFTWQGTIKLWDTILKVLQTKVVTVELGFKIASKNFMGDEILYELYEHLSQDAKLVYIWENPMKEENIPMHFWMSRFTGYFRKIETPIFKDENGEIIEICFHEKFTKSSLDYLFFWAMTSYADMAVQIIWNRGATHPMQKYKTLILMLKLISGDFRMANLTIYLLSVISEKDMEMYLQLRSAIIFKYLLLQLRWQSSFKKVLEVLHSGFEGAAYITIFKFMISIICSDNRDEFSECTLKDFLLKMPFAAKQQFLGEYDSLYYNMLQNLYNNNDFESCSVLLEIGGPLNEENLFSTSLVTILFDMHIFSGKYQVIDNIFEFYFDSTDSVNRLKRTFYNQKALHVCQIFITYQQWDNLNLFTNWCLSFVTLGDISLLKQDVLFVEDGKFIKKLIFQDQETDDALQLVDRVLEWYFGSQEAIKRFKSSIIMVKEMENSDIVDPQIINVYAEIRNCISKFRVPFLRRFFEWRDCSNEEISEIKNNLLKNNDFCTLIFSKRNVLNFFSLLAVL